MPQVRVHILWGAVVLLLMGSVSVTAAQPNEEATPPVRFRRLDGLSHNTVSSLLQDRQGFLWIGTADGLNRYDGYEFVVYRHLPSDSTSLVDNTVQALAEDPNGDLWVGTAGGLDRLDRGTGQFTHYDLAPGRPAASQSVSQVALDGAGRLWVATYLDSELYRYDRDARTFERYVLGEREGDVYDVEVGPEGRLWVVGDVGSGSSAEQSLYRYDAVQDHFHPVTTLQNGSLHAGHSGTLWIGGDLPGTLDTASAPLRRVGAPIPWGEARNEMHEARSGALWIGTGQGAFRYDPATEALRHYAIDTTGTSGLSNYVWDLVEDRAGLLWVGTRSGLYRHDPHRKPFAHLGPPEGVLLENGQSAVMTLRGDASGALWVGTLGGGLVRLCRVSGSHQSSGERYALPSDQVWALHEDQQGRVWVGTAAGLCVLNQSARRCVSHPPWGQGSAEPGPIYAFAESPDGTLWMGGTELYRLNPATGRVDAPVPLEYGQDFSTIQALHVDEAHRLWIGMEGGGLARYHPGTGDLDTDWETDLLNETVWTIHESAGGLLWLGTDVGLVRLDPATDSTAHYFDADRLPGSIVYSILEDDQEQLWMGTNQGLARFDPRTEQLRRFDASNGVRNTEFNRRAAVRSESGRFFFGGLRGITVFDPEAIRDNPYVPPVVITQMTKVNRTGTVSLNPYGREDVVLDYRDRVFTFEFAALNFTNPRKNRYAYQLDGFEDGWVEAGTRRVARYTNVPPGEYVFRVKGSNNDGVWNDEGASMRVTITPPFWQTWWFRFLIGALVVGGGVLAYRVRVRHLLRIERLRLRIASDLHDDIASQLASVAITSDVLRATADLDENERAELRQMGTLVRQTTETLRDIVWFVDPEHDRPEALLGKMKTTASTLLSEVDHRFDPPAPEQLDELEQLDVRARRNLFLIYKEALHNVVRHARAQTVQITLRPTADGIELTVTDDGIGFDPDDTEQWGQGMKTMRRRAEQMDATLALTSPPGEGTTLRLTVPES